MKKKNQNDPAQQFASSSKIDVTKQFNNAPLDQEEFASIFSDEGLDEYKKKVNDALNSTPDPSLSKTSYYLKPVQSSPYDNIEKEI